MDPAKLLNLANTLVRDREPAEAVRLNEKVADELRDLACLEEQRIQDLDGVPEGLSKVADLLCVLAWGKLPLMELELAVGGAAKCEPADWGSYPFRLWAVGQAQVLLGSENEE